MAIMGRDSTESPHLKALLIEDSEDQALLLRELLSESDDPAFSVEHADRLTSALALLGMTGFDVLILDLSLPDSHGTDTVARVRTAAAHVPIVVLTGQDDEDVAITAVQNGAQDYLVKGRVDSKALVRSIRYAIQRHRIQEGVRKMRKEFETGQFETLARPAESQAVSLNIAGFGPKRLLDSQLRSLAGRFREALEAAGSAGGDSLASGKLRLLADELGKLDAGPRDVMELHDLSLREAAAGATGSRREAYDAGGRRAVLELMGHLALYYQGASQPSLR